MRISAVGVFPDMCPGGKMSMPCVVYSFAPVSFVASTCIMVHGPGCHPGLGAFSFSGGFGNSLCIISGGVNTSADVASDSTAALTGVA